MTFALRRPGILGLVRRIPTWPTALQWTLEPAGSRAFSVQTKRNRRALGIEKKLDAEDSGPAQCSSPEQQRIFEAISLAARKQDWDAAAAAYNEVAGSAETLVCNAMLHAADRCDKLAVAFNVYSDMRNRNEIPKQAQTYTPLIRLAGRHAHPVLAHALLAEMRACGVEPNAHSYSALVDVYKSAGDTVGAKRAWEEMKARGIEVTAVTLSAMMSAIAKTGDVAATEALMHEAAEEGNLTPGTAHLNCVLDACQRAGDSEAALRVLREQRGHGVGPDVVSYTCALGALQRDGRPVADADQLLSEMKQDGVAPNSFFLETRVAFMLGVPLQDKNAKELLQKLPHEVLQAAAQVIQDAEEAKVPLTKLVKRANAMIQSLLPAAPPAAPPQATSDWVKVLNGNAGAGSAPEYYWDRASGRTQWEHPGVVLSGTVSAAAA